jgi:uncharacterized protein
MNEIVELEEIETPCIGQCCLDDDEVCLGCFRSLEEITGWAVADNDKRRQFLKNIEARKSAKSIS